MVQFFGYLVVGICMRHLIVSALLPNELKTKKSPPARYVPKRSVAMMRYTPSTSVPEPDRAEVLEAWRMYMAMRGLYDNLARDLETTDSDWVNHLELFHFLDQDVGCYLENKWDYQPLTTLAINRICNRSLREFCLLMRGAAY